MSATKVASAALTNPRAVPQVLNDIAASGKARSRTIAGTMELATTSIDDVGDVILVAAVRGNERIVSIKLSVDDLDTNATATLAFDVGIYKDMGADGTSATVVDADAYASAVLHDTIIKSGTSNGVEIAFEARDIAKMGQSVALDGAALTAESALGEHSLVRYIGLTVTAVAATAAAGTLSWCILAVDA